MNTEGESVASSGPRAEAARAGIREAITAKGHATANAQLAVERLDEAFATGALQRTPFLEQALSDLRVALEREEGQKLGGKSAEASRFILRAIDRMLDET
ncbi:hypothetical protein BH24CHL8_BH24CHL8_03820 [soil metagenome]